MARNVKIWLDDIRPMPDGYDIWCKSVNQTKNVIEQIEKLKYSGYEERIVELIDCDHDLGDYAQYGGDGIEILNWMERTGRCYCVRLHTMNPVGMERMRAVIHRNGWEEIA